MRRLARTPMQAHESAAGAPLLDRLRTYAAELSPRVSRARAQTTSTESPEQRTSLLGDGENVEQLELPEDWQDTDLEEAGVR